MPTCGAPCLSASSTRCECQAGGRLHLRCPALYPHRVRRGLLLAAAVVIGVAGVASAAPAPPPAPVCGPRAGKTVASEPKARVYSLDIAGKEAEFGCSPSGPHPWKLSPYGRGGLGGYRLRKPSLINGVWAGGVFTSNGRDTYRYMVRSRNLRTGEEIQCEAGGGIVPRRGERIYNVVLSAHGTLAWSGKYWREIYEPSVPPGPGATAPAPLPRFYVMKCNKTDSAVIERGEEIAVRSLKLTRQTLRWTSAGEEKTARLP